jgi:aminoglycoside phosphotransferase (APT) family kinase protein
MITQEQQRTSVAMPRIVPAALTTAQIDPMSSLALQQALPGLQAALDEPFMQVALEAALFEPDRAVVITQCELDQATYLPDPGCIMRYLLTIQDQQAGDRQVLVSGRLFPDQLTCEAYIHNHLLPLVPQLAGREELAGFARLVGVIAALHMAVYVFPLDADLPELLGATDRRVATALLGEVLQNELGPNFAVAECRVELVDYGRRQRATLRYHVTSQASETGTQQLLVYGKLTGDGSGVLAGPISDALRERMSALSSTFHFNVPRVLAWRPELQLSLLEAIPGKELVADALKALLRDKPFAGAALSIEEMLDACAKIAATLHTSGIQLGRPRLFEDELASLRRELAQIEPVSSVLGAHVTSRLDQIASAAMRSAPLSPCFNHGDFTYGQLLFDGANSGLVDFDSVCQAEPALDLAQFLTYLRIASLKSKLSPAATRALMDRLNDQFLQTYVDMTGGQTGELEQLVPRVAIYTAFSLVRRTLRSWQKFKPSRSESALALLAEEIEGFSF